MNNRVKEASDAVAFAKAMEDAAESGEKLLSVLQQYRKQDVLAMVPTSAADLRQLYADLIAEYVVNTEKEQNLPMPGNDEIARFGKTFAAEFETLFGGDENEYSKYAPSVLRTHDLYCKFVEAAAAYALLSPGKKGEADSTPDEENIQAAMQRERKVEKSITFDVISNQISPMERYARALSRPAPDQCQSVRIPNELISEALNAQTQNKKVSKEELALAAMLYYKYKPEAKNSFTDYYPVAVREMGAYLTRKDQAKALSRVMHEPQLLKFREIYFMGRGNQERRVMVALRQRVVENFISCNKEEAPNDSYLEIRMDTPRAIVTELGKLEISDAELIVSFLNRTQNSVPWEDQKDKLAKALKSIMETRLEIIRTDGCRGMSPTKLDVFKRIRDPAMCILKLCLAASFIRSGEESWENKEVSLEQLKEILNQQEEKLIQDLENAKKRVFEGKMTMSYGWKKKKALFKCSIQP